MMDNPKVRRRWARFPMQLPPTPCSAEMRGALVAVAEQGKVSLAEVQRCAFSLFLTQFDSNPNVLSALISSDLNHLSLGNKNHGNNP